MQEKIGSLVYDLCHPNILPEIYTVNIEGRLILVVEVFRGNLLPYYLKSKGLHEGTYVRIGSTNRVADEAMIHDLQRQRMHRSFDEEESYTVSLESLDLSPLYEAFERIGRPCDINKLANLKLVVASRGNFLPTNALLIVLGKLDNVEIKCARFKGTTMEHFIDKKEFRGDLFSQLEQTNGFLKNHLYLQATIEDLQRSEQYEIPIPALREIILNAIVHRDYTRNGDIKVAIYDDIVEITSIGGLVNGLTIEEIGNGRSELRNKILANLFRELGYIESWGSGISRVRSLCEEAGISFELVEKGSFVTASFRRPKLAEIGRSFNEESANTGEYRRIPANTGEKIVAYVQEHQKITAHDLQLLLSVKASRAREILSEMVKEGILEKIGKTRGSYYIIKSPRRANNESKNSGKYEV